MQNFGPQRLRLSLAGVVLGKRGFRFVQMKLIRPGEVLFKEPKRGKIS